MIRVGKVSSVFWDLYIVKNLFKGEVEEEYSEDGRCNDYRGKYFLLLDSV